MVTLNKWQRLVITLGAIICLLQAYSLWADDPDDWRPGLTFLGGIALAVLALTPRRDGEEVLPFAASLRAHRKEALIGVAVVGAGALFLILAQPFASETSYEEVAYEETMAAETELRAETELPYGNTAAPSQALEDWRAQQELETEAPYEPLSSLPIVKDDAYPWRLSR